MPANSRQYEYTPLKSVPFQIRLMKIQRGLDITLQTFKLTDAPPFIALSYVWGAPEPRYTIICDGSSMVILPTLVSFLKAIQRRPTQPWFWIDSICIDQSDMQEKSLTVTRMPDIFRTARYTFCWLGLDNNHIVRNFIQVMSSCVQAYEATIARLFSTTDIMHSSYRPTADDLDLFETATNLISDPAWRSLDAFLSKTYLTKLWIVQEIVCSRCPVIVDEFEDISWAQFAATLLICRFLAPIQRLRSPGASFVLYCESMRRQYQVHKSLPIIQRSRWPFTRKTSTFAHSTQPNAMDGTPLTLPDILSVMHSSATGTTDPRDHVYALYSFGQQLHSEHDRPGVDYKLQTSNVYIKASSTINFLSGQPLSLSLADSDKPNSLGLPSWSANWQMRSDRFLINHNASNFATSWHTVRADRAWRHVSDGHITCTGFVSDTIKDVSEYLPPRSKCDHYVASGDNSFFFVEWIEFAKERSRSTLAEENILLDYADTIQARGCNHMWEMAEQSTHDRLRQVKEFLHFLEDPEADEKRSIQLFYAACLPSHDRRFGITENRHFCIVPKATKRGDLVCIPHGSRVPYVFRQHKDSESVLRYRNIGECYVHGMMYGEMKSRIEDIERRDFDLF